MNDKDIKLLAERISLKLKDINNFEKDIRKEERKAFADWLENWAVSFYGKTWRKDWLPNTAISKLVAKIKQLRSKPLLKSLEGKDK